MMPHFTLRLKALEDLEAIWRYSVERWGQRQADNYIRQLSESFKLLAAEPGIGVDCSYIHLGYRKYPVQRHVIFYRSVSENQIEIIRILHERMDLEEHVSD